MQKGIKSILVVVLLGFFTVASARVSQEKIDSFEPARDGGDSRGKF